MKSHRHEILVIGCGSIGERHVRTFLSTGRARVFACDTRAAVRQLMIEKYKVETTADWMTTLISPALTAVIVATPASSHVEIATQALNLKKHVLVEKPLAVELVGTDQLLTVRDRSRRFAAVAYVRHCVPALHEAREFIQTRRFGAVRHVMVTTGEDFPASRPAYRDIYYRDRAQGGGAIQDALTHMANAVEWVLGPTTRVYCDASHQLLAGVEVEDTVNVTARNGDALVSYALNQFQVPNEIRMDFHAELGSVRIELPERWGTQARGEKEWTWRLATVTSRDAIFTAQANAFLDGCEGKPTMLCTLEEGIQALRFNLAALQSWKQAMPVEIEH